jgi:septum formation protein
VDIGRYCDRLRLGIYESLYWDFERGSPVGREVYGTHASVSGASSLESGGMLILASASPRRQELLRNARIPFVVQAADIDERVRDGESPRDCAERLAREKAVTVSRSRPGDCVLGADTIVVVDGNILGKPRDADDAARMLRMLSGRVHEVITGVCLAGVRDQGSGVGKSKTQATPVLRGVDEQLATGNRQLTTASETTLVTMSGLSDDDIREYVATGEPMDKAGAYAIQGIASRWIPRIEGDYSNVVGLPVALVYRMLLEQGAL